MVTDGEFSQIQGQMYKPLSRSSSWPKEAGQSKQTRQSISHIFNPFSSSGVHMPSCRDQGKRLAGLGLGFTFSEPGSDSGRKATQLGRVQEQKYPVPGVSCPPQPRLRHHEFMFLQRQIAIHSCKMRRVGHKVQSLCLRWECLKQSVQLPADQRACPGVALCGCCDRRAPAGFWHPRLVTEAMPCEVTQACHQSGGSEMGKEPRPPRQPLCRGLHGYCEVCTAWPSCSGLGAACSEEA